MRTSFSVGRRDELPEFSGLTLGRAIRASIALLGMFGVACSGSADGDSYSGESELVLRTMWSHPLPDSFFLDGAIVLDSLRALAWSAQTGQLLMVSDGGVSDVGDSGDVERPIGAHWDAQSRELFVCDGERRRIVTYDSTLSVKHFIPFRLTGRAQEAVFSRDKWYVGSRSEEGRYEIAEISLTDTPPVILNSRADTNPHQRYLLAAHSDGFILTPMRGANGREIYRSDDALRTSQPEYREAVQNAPLTTVALRTVAIDSGFLGIMADLTSDKRVLQVLDQQGIVRRSSTVNAALGPLASDPRRRVLLMSRVTNSTEIVSYGWGWK